MILDGDEFSFEAYQAGEYGDHLIIHGDCLKVLPKIPDKAVDLVLTDPPYQCGKAAWDSYVGSDWLLESARFAKKVAVMPGIANLLRLPYHCADLVYRWMLVAYLANSMTRGAFGYGKYIPCIVYASADESLFVKGRDLEKVTIKDSLEPSMPNHPSPKPNRAMRYFISNLPGGLICDPFLGSGTTLVAAKQLGRRGIGIEIERKYCEIAEERLRQEILAL